MGEPNSADVTPGLAISQDYSIITVPDVTVVSPGAKMKYVCLYRHGENYQTVMGESGGQVYTGYQDSFNWFVIPESAVIRSKSAGEIQLGVRQGGNQPRFEYEWPDDQGKYFVVCGINFQKDGEKWCFVGQRVTRLDAVMARMWFDGRNQAPAQADGAVAHVDAYIEDVKLAYTKLPVKLDFDHPEKAIAALESQGNTTVAGQMKMYKQFKEKSPRTEQDDKEAANWEGWARQEFNRQRQEKFDKQINDLQEYRNKLAEVLKSTDGKMRVPFKALHFGTQSQNPTWLNVFVCKVDSKPATQRWVASQGYTGYVTDPAQQHWKLVDWTFPTQDLPKDVDGYGETDEAALKELFYNWNHYRNKYPTGRLQYQLIHGTIRMAEAFDTDGTTRWDHVVTWLGVITTAALLLTGVGWVCGPAVLMWGVTGEAVASTGMWVMVFSSTAAATINIAQRQALGIGSWKDNAFDGLTIVGNLLAGIGAVARVASVAEQAAVREAWARGAYVEFTDISGTVLKGCLIGQVGDNMIQGILVAEESMEEYERLTKDPNISPEERVARLITWSRNLAFSGLMTFISVKGTLSDIQALKQEAKIAKNAAKFSEDPNLVKTPNEKLDMVANPKERLKVTTKPVTEGEIPQPKAKTKRQVTKHTSRAEIAKTAGELKGPDAEKAIAASGMVKEHALGTSDVAQERGEYYLVQATNPSATKNIPTSATKNMHIKGKSAEGGPADGFIPIDQAQSKKVREPSSALLKEYGDKEGVLKHYNEEVQKCLKNGDAIVVKVKSAEPPPDFVEVLGDPKTGKPITADYDLLSVGTKTPEKALPPDPEMGNVTENDEERIGDLNTKLERNDAPVFHHGAANNAPVNPGINYPVTAFEPNGNIVSIPKGPKENPDQYLKEYFNKVNDSGYHMDPHKDWGWTKQDGHWQ